MAKPKDDGEIAIPAPTIARPKCGIIMPISAIDGCTEQHWADVKSIITDALESAGFEANLVSNADDVGIIQKRIVQNLYENPVIVCDVSGKNPNVMFELGMRLAFDKPTIIVKDDKTTYSFDTSLIEHLEYPRDLRFAKVVEFKKSLAEKTKATAEKAAGDKSYTTFLKHFGQFSVPKLDTREVSTDQYILNELQDLRRSLMLLVSPKRDEDAEVKRFRFTGYARGVLKEMKNEPGFEWPKMRTEFQQRLLTDVPVEYLPPAKDFPAWVQSAVAGLV